MKRPVRRILIAEDLEALRRLAVRVLTVEGFECVGAGNAPDAIRLCRGERFDLLITDHDLPGGDGPTIARAALEGNPATRVLFISGRPASTLDLDLPGATSDFLAKPFDIGELVATARDLLAS